jgi:Flp pilus assembly protein TadD
MAGAGTLGHASAASRVHRAAARAALRRGDMATARVEAQAAVDLNFTDPRSHRLLAEILERGRDAAGARIHYVLALHLGWDHVEIRRAIARTARAAERLTTERRYLGVIAQAHDALASRDLDSARRHARAGVVLDSTRPEAFNLLGVLEEVAGRRAEAQRNYRIALELAPDYAPAAENLAGTVRPRAERGRPAW